MLFPNLTLLGARAPLVAGIPIAATGFAALWQRLLPKPRVARIASEIALVAWFAIGALTSLGWWSFPAILAMAVAISRPEAMPRAA